MRYGLSFEAPLYVHELYVLRQKAELQRQKAETDRQLDLLGRQAAVVYPEQRPDLISRALKSPLTPGAIRWAKPFEDMALKVEKRKISGIRSAKNPKGPQ
ncbi:MAG: hypothetical protein U5J82_01275 [Desulfobacterales bacterium]|nr:hypothetical protein [Desulfobacterales bacterium]